MTTIKDYIANTTDLNWYDFCQEDTLNHITRDARICTELQLKAALVASGSIIALTEDTFAGAGIEGEAWDNFTKIERVPTEDFAETFLKQAEFYLAEDYDRSDQDLKEHVEDMYETLI